MPSNILESVGFKGKNNPVDVRTVQDLINTVIPGNGGPNQPVTVNGAAGPETVAAISRFQTHNLLWRDGRVDPNAPTIGKLNELASKTVVIQPSFIASAKPKQNPFPGPATAATNGAATVRPFVYPFTSLPRDSFDCTQTNDGAFIFDVRGDVRMKQPSSHWLQAFSGLFVGVNGWVDTGEDGSCTLVFLPSGTKVGLGPTTLMLVYGEYKCTQSGRTQVQDPSEVHRGLQALAGK